MEEFVDDEFFMKLIRLGVKRPDLRSQIRGILQEIHRSREDRDIDQEIPSDLTE